MNDVPDTVPAYIAANAGSTLVITGSVESGADARVVTGAGPYLGLEAAAPPRERARAMQLNWWSPDRWHVRRRTPPC